MEETTRITSRSNNTHASTNIHIHERKKKTPISTYFENTTFLYIWKYDISLYSKKIL